MRVSYTSIIFIVICLLVGTSVFATSLFTTKPNFLLGDMQSIWSGVSRDERVQLVQENADLKNQLYAHAHDVVVRDTHTIHAKVFSLYPFNTKNRVYIDQGSDDGVSVRGTALFSSRVFFGFIASVSTHTSEIKTVFDSSLEVAVRVGDHEVNGLLQGGLAPRVTLIDKSKQIRVGDLIVTAAKDMPYGLTIGTVKEVHEDSLGAFLEATISLPYSLSDVRTISIAL